jgi:methylenetetrahydrofolate dehydrogenase (NADP+)/methenyltetrahydrofolate cyclohydrolase
MDTLILNGRQVSQNIRNEIKNKVDKLPVKPGLAVIQAGNDAASTDYIKNKEKACREVGIYWEKINLPEDTKPERLLTEIDRLNRDKKINGVLVQFPLPANLSGIEEKVINAIDPKKDVDGFHPYNVGQYVSCKGNSCNNLLLPCTPYGIIRLLDAYKIPISGKHAVVVGRSNLAGKPVSILLLSRDATVTICHSKTENLPLLTRQADILVAAVGKPNFIDQTYIKPGTVLVDVGINLTDKGFVGDVDFEKVKPLCFAITPVPGGVGPMTVAVLMENVLKAYQLQNP